MSDAMAIRDNDPLARKVSEILAVLRSEVAEEAGARPAFVMVQLQMPDDSVFEMRVGADPCDGCGGLEMAQGAVQP